MFFLTDDNGDDKGDDDANSNNGGEVSGRKEKGPEVMGGERLVNIYQSLSAYCLEFYFSEDGPRVISSFPFQ